MVLLIIWFVWKLIVVIVWIIEKIKLIKLLISIEIYGVVLLKIEVNFKLNIMFEKVLIIIIFFKLMLMILLCLEKVFLIFVKIRGVV